MSIAIFNYGKGGAAGAELNITAYSAVGSLPASADEGAVAVITSTAIGDTHVSNDEPSSPASGDVWLWTGNENLAPVFLTDFIVLSPRACFQYNGSSWDYVESYVYHSSAWVEITLYVYLTGDFFLSDSYSGVSGGDNNWSSVTISLEDNYIQYICTGTGDREVRYGFTTDPIDLTDVDSITFVTSTYGNIDTRYVGVKTDRSYGFNAQASFAAGTEVSTTLDVSALSGYYYPGVRAGRYSTGSANVDKCWILSILLNRS